MLYRFADAGDRRAAPLRRGQAHACAAQRCARRNDVVLHREGQEDGNIAPFVPFLLAFGILGIVMSVLIVANVVSGAVVSGYRRIGILKSIGFTPLQVAAAYAARSRCRRSSAASPASWSATCLRLRSFGRTRPPTASAGSTSRSGSTSSCPPESAPSPPSRRCYPRCEPDGSAPFRRSRPDARRARARLRGPPAARPAAAPAPVTIGLAAPFARPSRTPADARGRPARRDRGHVRGRTHLVAERLLDGISHQQAEPVQIQMPGNGFHGGPQQVTVGPKHFKAGPPTRGAAGSDREGRAGDPRRSPRPTGHTPRRRPGRRLRERVGAFGAGSGHGVPRRRRLDRLRPRQRPLVHGAGPGACPDRLPHADRDVGRRHDLARRRAQAAPRADRRRGLRHAEPGPEHRDELADPPHTRSGRRPRPVRRRPATRHVDQAPTCTRSANASAPTTSSN